MTTNAGMFLSNQFTAEHSRRSFASAIVRLMPNGTAPLFAISSMLGTETAINYEHGFFNKAAVFPSITVNGAHLLTDTTIVVDSSAEVVPGSVLRIPSSGENVIVNSVTDSTHIVVTRGVGTTAAAAISDNELCMQVATAFEEGSNRPQALQVQPGKITNLTQIFRNSWAVSNTARSILMEAGDGNVAESRQDCGAFHATQIEQALIFSQKYSGTRNGKPFRTMDGLIAITGNLTYYPSSYASANVFTAGATTNLTQLEAMLDPTLNQITDPTMGNERIIFTGAAGINVINGIGRLSGTYQLIDGQTNFGLQFRTLKTARGTFRLIEHPLFNTNATWAKMAVVADPATFRLAYLGNRDTVSEEYGFDGTNVQDGIDAVGGSLTTELTCEVRVPSANAVIYNLTAAA